MEYLVIFAYKQSVFEKDVNSAMALGWKPQGGISIATNATTGAIYFSQAMIRETK